MSDVWDQEADVPYSELGKRFFAKEGRQEMIPFLGAGVSVSARTTTSWPNPPGFPDAPTMEAICALVQLPPDATAARPFLEYAIRAALWMREIEPSQPTAPIASRLEAETYPPFAYELSLFLSELAAYSQFQDRPLSCLRSRSLLSDPNSANATESMVRMLKLLAEVTGLAQTADPLASIAEFHEYKTERKSLRESLAEVFRNKVTPTPTHQLIARAAKYHLTRPFAEDYLIITTNYDALMEKALDAEEVPYAVITVDRTERHAHAHFAGLSPREHQALTQRNPAVPARQMQLNKGARTLAIVFKMHGCLNPELNAPDGIVITETDYVNFVSHLEEVLPAVVGALLPTKRLLFLGYSFSDWNVRSIYESIARRSDERVRDYAVTRMLSKFERLYFHQRNIGLILQDLGAFTARLSSFDPALAGVQA